MARFRVLIVDDYPEAAETACLLLSMLGHDCRAATSASEALVEVTRFEPEVAMLDLGLPDMSGYDLARELRRRLTGPLFLAAVTGWGQPDDRVRALAAGFDCHVLKPADQGKLMRIIELAEQRWLVTSSDPGRS
jgi:CheY-like chemotaxis protein